MFAISKSTGIPYQKKLGYAVFLHGHPNPSSIFKVSVQPNNFTSAALPCADKDGFN